MTVTDELLQNNQRYAERFDKGDLSLPPAKGVAVVACMDARLHVSKILGLSEGDAHIIRNAGGVVTDDEIRSLAISQRLLGTREIILIHHTGSVTLFGRAGSLPARPASRLARASWARRGETHIARRAGTLPGLAWCT